MKLVVRLLAEGPAAFGGEDQDAEAEDGPDAPEDAASAAEEQA